MLNFGEDILLDTRLHGLPEPVVGIPGQSVTKEYLFEFDCKFNGIQIICDGNVAYGDTLCLETHIKPNPASNFWMFYKKFGKGWWLSPNSKQDILLFPTLPKAGTTKMLVHLTSTGAVAPKIYLNLYTFVDRPVTWVGETW